MNCWYVKSIEEKYPLCQLLVSQSHQIQQVLKYMPGNIDGLKRRYHERSSNLKHSFRIQNCNNTFKSVQHHSYIRRTNTRKLYESSRTR